MAATGWFLSEEPNIYAVIQSRIGYIFLFFLKPVIQNKRMDNWSLDILTLQSVAGTDDFKYPKEQLQVKSKFK